MQSPISTRDKISGRHYEAHVRNESAVGRPLVFYAGLGTVATGSTTSRIWHRYMEALADAHDGPVMHLAPEGSMRGWRSFAQRAAADGRVLDELGVESHDILGVSSGGLLAAYVAAETGRRAVCLVTASAVGTRRPIDYMRALPAQLLDSGRTSVRTLRGSGVKTASGTGVGKLLDVRRYPELIQTASLAVRASLGSATDRLDPGTHWTAIVGAHDALTSPQEQEQLVLERNRHVPGGAELVVVDDIAHVWSSRTRELAQLAVHSIKKKS